MSDELQNITVDECEQLVVFELANEYYGVNISSVNTIIRMQEITRIPRVPDFINGVINLRGSIIPVIDLRKRFSLPEGESSKASRIIVVEAGGQMIGMTVDAVAETLRLRKDDIELPSPVVCSIDSDFLRGVGKQENRLVILLNIDQILTMQDFNSLSRIDEQSVSSFLEQKAAA